ncbi:MAG: hypothetical protein AUI83_12590 [Armatimonadetes bacterium 13_1_40CM_3_65_7]|nr:MAG: hypothetical protein AUI83_12590 [Armatimonadetes bacterium 13_1_40CM_3_65_7]
MVLLDRAPVGDGVTSACGAPVSIVRAMGAEASIQLIHDRLVLHTRAGETVWPLPEPFCTFDYRRFCELAFAHAGVEFIQAAVTHCLWTPPDGGLFSPEGPARRT